MTVLAAVDLGVKLGLALWDGIAEAIKRIQAGDPPKTAELRGTIQGRLDQTFDQWMADAKAGADAKADQAAKDAFGG